MTTEAIDRRELAASARSDLDAAGDGAALEAWRIAYLGRKGRLTLVLRRLGELSLESAAA